MRVFSEEHKANLSKAQKGKKQTPEHVAKRVAKNRGQTRTAEQRARISEAGKGHECSKETRAKISASKKGEVWTKSRRANFSETRKRLEYHHSDETKQKISDGNCGKVISKLQITKNRTVNLGRKHTDAAKRNMSRAQVLRIQRGGEPRNNYISGWFNSLKNKQWFWYRSSWERRVMEALEHAPTVSNFDVEPFSIEYVDGGYGVRHYVPDILVTYTNGTRQLVEIGWDTKGKRFKYAAAEDWCVRNKVQFVKIIGL